MTVRFGILGELEVRAGGRTAHLGPPKQRLLLAILLCRLGEVVPVPELIDAVWEHDPPASAAENVRSYVHRLRRLLGDGVVLRRASGGHGCGGSHGGYGLVADTDSVDSHRFAGIARRGEAALAHGDPAGARVLLREALALWRGRPFAGLDLPAMLATEAVRLEEQRLAVAERCIDAELRAGAGSEVVAELRVLVAANPYRERYWGQLMTALHRSGRRADALGAFHEARAVLADELGIDPGAELTSLYLRMLRDDRVRPVYDSGIRCQTCESILVPSP